MNTFLLRTALAALALLVADQASKHWIVSHYELLQEFEVNSLLNIVRVHNYGAAFSFLSDASGWQKYFFTGLGIVASVVMAVWAYRSPTQPRLVVALCLIISGAIGNVIDRINYGYVVDFIDIHIGGVHWPAFNVADSCICIGAALLILDEVLNAKKRKS